MVEVEEKGGEREVERNEDNEKKVDGREKWNVKGGGGVRGYRKMGRGARFDTRALLTFILSLSVDGARFLA